MLYKTIYMTHDLSTLVTNTKKSIDTCEMTEWDTPLATTVTAAPPISTTFSSVINGVSTGSLI